MLELKEIDGQDYGKDTVEVIRCKDCAYSEGLEPSRYRFCICKMFNRLAPIDGFCDTAERIGQ